MKTIKNNFKKFLVVLLCVILIFDFTMVPKVQAFAISDIGGMLYNLILSLVNLLADAAQKMIQAFMLGVGWDDLMLDYNTAIKNSSILKWRNNEDYYAKVTSNENCDETNCKEHTNHKNELPYIQYTPETIFSGKVPMLSVDFISGKYYDGSGNSVKNTDDDWRAIQKTVSSWYKVIRMIAIIAFLSILIYTGIKIILSSNARDKAKYKEWVINWFMGVIILFTMHYMMGFILSITGEVSNLLTNACGDVKIGWYGTDESDDVDDDPPYILTTNLMGYTRLMAESCDVYTSVGFEVMYIMLIVMTYKFTFVYLKRVLTMAFLTIIAPIVAFLYPIDKMNDGSAQAFNMWFKEYLFNALLQPMHLLLYYVILGSAVEIAVSNPLYGVIALMFLSEAEKIFKRIFGFDKANGGTVGGFAGGVAAGATAAALASGVKNVAGMIKGGKGGNGSSGHGEVGGSSNHGGNPALEEAKPTMSAEEEMQDFMDNGNSGDSQQNDGSGSDDSNGDNNDNNSMDDLETERQNTASERSVLEEFEAEGATSDDWTDGDYEAYMELEREQQEREARLQEREEQESGTQGSEQQDNGQRDSNQGDNGGQESENADNGVTPQNTDANRSDSIREIAENKNKGRFSRGMKAVGKRMLRPIWDVNKSGKYNGKRWARRVGGLAKTAAKIGTGVVVGGAATMIQAGISMADGKYNPLEGVATLSAGFAAGASAGDRAINGVGKRLSGIRDVYRQGAESGNKEAKMNRALESFRNDDKVIEFNQRNYKPEEQKDIMKREQELIKNNGIKDLKDQKKCFKYTSSQMKNWEAKQKDKGVDVTDEMRKQQQAKFDQKSAATLNFQNRLKDQGQLGAVHDQKKRNEYINTMIKQEAGDDAQKADQVRRKYNNAFNSVVAFQEANK